MLVIVCPRIWGSSALCEVVLRARRCAARDRASHFSVSADTVICACRIGKVPASVPADTKNPIRKAPFRGRTKPARFMVTFHGPAGGTPQAHARAGRSSLGRGRTANSPAQGRAQTAPPSCRALPPRCPRYEPRRPDGWPVKSNAHSPVPEGPMAMTFTATTRA